MNFKDTFLTIAREAPSLSPAQVFALAGKLASDADLSYVASDKESLGRFALTVPAVVAAARADRKISAIKELRQAATCGLKEAKDAVESLIFTSVYTNFKQ